MADVDLKSILQRDVDDVLAFGRDVSGRDRTRVLHAAIRSIQESDDPLCRLKALTLIQTLLSQTQKGRLAVSLASTLARTLSAIVSDAEEIVDLRLSAISGLMLLIIKIRSTTQSIDNAIRSAINVAQKDREARVRRDAAKVRKLLERHDRDGLPEERPTNMAKAVTPLDEQLQVLIPRLLTFTTFTLEQSKKAHPLRSLTVFEKRASDYVQEAVVRLIEGRTSASRSNVFKQLCLMIRRLVDQDYASQRAPKGAAPTKVQFGQGKTAITVLEYLPDIEDQIYTRDRVRGYIDALSPISQRDAWLRLAGRQPRTAKQRTRAKHSATTHR